MAREPSGSQRPRLTGSVAIVTGGTAGLGRAACEALAREGADVAIVGRNEERLAEVGQSVEAAGRRALPLRLEVQREDHMAEMAQRTVEAFGRIDILITSAGLLRPPGTRRMEMMARTPKADWDTLVDINLTGTFLSVRAVLPQMLRQRHGDILTISSKSGRTGLAYDSAYCATKFAIIGLTESVAEEVRAQGVRAQCLLPGEFDTALWDQNPSFGRPEGLPPPDRVADLMLYMITLPRDTYLDAPLTEPLRPLNRFRAGG
ncbi:MAG: SDR family oxidoreductase [Planctomycetota bacterium]